MSKTRTITLLALAFVAANITAIAAHEYAHCVSGGAPLDCRVDAHVDEHPFHASHYQESDHSWLNPLTPVFAGLAMYAYCRVLVPRPTTP